MDRIKCTIKISGTVDSFVDRLKFITIEKQPFYKPKGVLFLGKINGNSFKLITFDAPPMKFFFEIKQNEVFMEYQKDSLTKVFTGLIYAITIPLFIILWTYAMIDKSFDMPSKIILTFCLFLPFILNKVIKFVYERFILADDNRFLEDLERILHVKIERHSAQQRV